MGQDPHKCLQLTCMLYIASQRKNSPSVACDPLASRPGIPVGLLVPIRRRLAAS